MSSGSKLTARRSTVADFREEEFDGDVRSTSLRSRNMKRVSKRRAPDAMGSTHPGNSGRL